MPSSQEAYDAAIQDFPHSPEGEALDVGGVPPLEWEGWERIAEDIISNEDPSNALRVRHAAKLALAADEANLSGSRVDLARVEGRLHELCSGAAPAEELMETVSGGGACVLGGGSREEPPPRAVILP